MRFGMRERIQLRQGSSNNAAMRNGDEWVRFSLSKEERHFLLHANPKGVVQLTRWNHALRVSLHPGFGVRGKPLFDLLPGEAFPCAETDLTQARPQMHRKVEVRSDQFG